MKTAGNIFIIELKTSKGEDRGKPSPTGTRRKDVFGAQAQKLGLTGGRSRKDNTG